MSVHIHAPPPTNTFVQVRRLRCRKWETVSEPKSFEAAVVYASRQLRFPDVKEVRVLNTFEWYDPHVAWQAAVHPYPRPKVTAHAE